MQTQRHRFLLTSPIPYLRESQQYEQVYLLDLSYDVYKELLKLQNDSSMPT